jgi:hypothetical protein
MSSECDEPTHSEEIETMVSEAMRLIGNRRFAEARMLVERIEGADPTNNWGAHARIHLHIDEGSLEEGATRGIAHLTATDPFEGINVHNAMHLATILLDLGRIEESVAWQARVVVPVAETMPMQYPSATHLLWRTEVAGHGRTSGRALPWEILVRPGATALMSPGDLPDPLDAIAHAMAWIANGDGARREALLGALMHRGLKDSGRPEAAANVTTVAQVVEGLYRWWEGDFAGAVNALGAAEAGFGALTQYSGQLAAIEATLDHARAQASAVRSDALPR